VNPRPDDPTAAGSPSSQDVAGRLVELVAALRSKGIQAGTSETVDAAAVVEVLGMSDRGQLREGLAAALVRRGGQRDVFDMVFDLYFPAGVGAPQAALDVDETFDIDDLRDLLAMAVAENDLRTLEQVAEIAVDLLGRVGTEPNANSGFSAYQTLERLRPQTLLVQALQQRGENRGRAPARVPVGRAPRRATSPSASSATRSAGTSSGSASWSPARPDGGRRRSVVVTP
jgi:uncharacterized protein with von Willebrand factor type A (vWA) domain